MGNIIFVHGTGVREPLYTNTFKIIENAINEYLSGWTLVRCYWGEPHGARLHQNGDSIPIYSTARSISEDISEEDYEIALWALLYQDPLYELRSFTLIQLELKHELAPREEPFWQRVQQKVQRFNPSLNLLTLLEGNGLAGIFRDAIKQITENPIFYEAIRLVKSDDEDAIDTIIARALIAQVAVLSEENNVPPISGKCRDNIVKQLFAELGGNTRSIKRFVFSPINGLALYMATNLLKRKRGVLSDKAAPIVGDILLYQTRGSDIRAFIRDQIAALSDPVTIIAHSLGSIACIDMLKCEKLDNVKTLITVGSQSSLFYELDCLSNWRYGEHLHKNFPHWLNVYDPQDILSFVGSNIFPGMVEDFEVQSFQPFPQSHSAYWTNPAFWSKVSSFLQ